MKKIKLLITASALAITITTFAQEKIILKGKELFGDIKARHIGRSEEHTSELQSQ